MSIMYLIVIYGIETSHKFFKFNEDACGHETPPGNTYIHKEVAVLLVHVFPL